LIPVCVFRGVVAWFPRSPARALWRLGWPLCSGTVASRGSFLIPSLSHLGSQGAAGRTVARISGLRRQPGTLCVGIPAFGGARGRPVARSHGFMVWDGSLENSTLGFLHLEEPGGRPVGGSHGLMVWGGSLGSFTSGFLHLEEPGGAAGSTVARSNGLGRRPGELCVGIPAFGGARGRPVARSHGVMV